MLVGKGGKLFKSELFVEPESETRVRAAQRTRQHLEAALGCQTSRAAGKSKTAQKSRNYGEFEGLLSTPKRIVSFSSIFIPRVCLGTK